MSNFKLFRGLLKSKYLTLDFTFNYRLEINKKNAPKTQL